MTDNRRLNVVVLDSGIAADDDRWKAHHIEQYIFVDNHWKSDCFFRPLHGHGTAITSILLKNISVTVNLFSFVLFEEKLSVDIRT